MGVLRIKFGFFIRVVSYFYYGVINLVFILLFLSFYCCFEKKSKVWIIWVNIFKDFWL